MTTNSPATHEQRTPAVASRDGIDALVRFLENRGDDFLSWRDGCIVVETYYDKQFRALGGDTNRLISFFEDYCNMNDAARHYIAALRKASNSEIRRPGPDAPEQNSRRQPGSPASNG